MRRSWDRSHSLFVFWRTSYASATLWGLLCSDGRAVLVSWFFFSCPLGSGTPISLHLIAFVTLFVVVLSSPFLPTVPLACLAGRVNVTLIALRLSRMQ